MDWVVHWLLLTCCFNCCWCVKEWRNSLVKDVLNAQTLVNYTWCFVYDEVFVYTVHLLMPLNLYNASSFYTIPTTACTCIIHTAQSILGSTCLICNMNSRREFQVHVVNTSGIYTVPTTVCEHTICTIQSTIRSTRHVFLHTTARVPVQNYYYYFFFERCSSWA